MITLGPLEDVAALASLGLRMNRLAELGNQLRARLAGIEQGEIFLSRLIGGHVDGASSTAQ